MSDSANELVIVGHGPSADHALDDLVDSFKVCRLKFAPMQVGTRTDIICSPFLKHKKKDIEFWHLREDLEEEAWGFYKKFNPRIPKPSVGVSACILAHFRNYDISVVGFDAVMNGGMRGWRHDAKTEKRCLESLNVKVL